MYQTGSNLMSIQWDALAVAYMWMQFIALPHSNPNHKMTYVTTVYYVLCEQQFEIKESIMTGTECTCSSITLRRIRCRAPSFTTLWWWWRITINEEILHPGLTITISTWHIFENNTYNRKACQTLSIECTYLV